MKNDNADVQKIFKSSFIEQIKKRLANNDYSQYEGEAFPFTNDDTWINPEIKIDAPALKMPDNDANYDGENAILFFEAFKNLTPTLATDIRLWTYLTHVTYWEYMNKRRPILAQPKEERANYILVHWHINSLSATNLTRNDISLLWWGAYLTYDSSYPDPYSLTKELFSMLDYTRDLLPAVQGWNRNFLHALLQFRIDNEDLFRKYKQDKIRTIMRKANFQGGYKTFTSLSKNEIMRILSTYKDAIEETKLG